MNGLWLFCIQLFTWWAFFSCWIYFLTHHIYDYKARLKGWSGCIKVLALQNHCFTTSFLQVKIQKKYVQRIAMTLTFLKSHSLSIYATLCFIGITSSFPQKRAITNVSIIHENCLILRSLCCYFSVRISIAATVFVKSESAFVSVTMNLEIRLKIITYFSKTLQSYFYTVALFIWGTPCSVTFHYVAEIID